MTGHPAPIPVYVTHFERPWTDEGWTDDRNRVARLCVGDETIVEVTYYARDGYEDESAAAAIADELRKPLLREGNPE